MNSKTIFLNDKFLPYEQAFVHIEDRGFQLGDGIYEVILFVNNKLIDFNDHIERLFRSAKEISLKIDKTIQDFKDISLELFQKNNLNSGSIYIQVTRGKNPRNQNFPKNYTTTINAVVSPLKEVNQESLINGSKAITHDDIRWGRCDIKSICLLAGTMIKNKATNQNAAEAILIKDGFITEGSFSNVFIVNNKNQIITREASNQILKGITRTRIISLAKQNNFEVIESRFNKKELLNAKEVFVTSSTLKIRPINQIDDKIIGNGKTGVISKKLIELYDSYCT